MSPRFYRLPRALLLSIFFTALCPLFASANPALGPGGTGGGNTVGGQLIDDAVNEGVVKLTPAQVTVNVAPYLTNLDAKLPGFANALRKGLGGIFWYLDPKALKQSGGCVDDTSLDFGSQQVVRACQTTFDVRIDMNWSKDNAALLNQLMLHELLVYQTLHGAKNVSEEGLFAVSRELRDTNPQAELSADELADLVKRAGFGDYATKALYDRFAAIKKKAMQIVKQTGCMQTVDFGNTSVEMGMGSNVILDRIPDYVKLFDGHATLPKELETMQSQLIEQIGDACGGGL